MSQVEYEQARIAEWGWEKPSSAFLAGPVPAAGAGFSYVCPGTAEQVVMAVSFHLVASADAANRHAVFQFIDYDGTSYAPVAAPYLNTASHTTDYTFAVGVQQSGADDAANITAGIPPVKLAKGLGIKVSVTNIQAADVISQVRLLLEQWPVRP